MINWQLSAAYFVHMLASVVWVGGIALAVLVVWPAAQRVLNDESEQLLVEWQRRFSPLVMLSLVALVVTGLIQMSANPNYTGLFKIDNVWSAAILGKHIAFGVMVVISAYLAWGLYPQMARLPLLAIKHKAQAIEIRATLRRRQIRLNRLNLICAVLVLAFTAIARVV
ncbi:MAG: CopD family protein [Acidiferrobacterales bacterium]